MPVKVMKRNGMFRITEKGKIAKNKGGTALDGGGHTNKPQADAQARAVNASLSRRGKI